MGHPVKKVSSKILERALKVTGLNVADLSSELGVSSPSSIQAWRRAGECPAYIGVACEAVMQRHKPRTTRKPDEAELVLWVKIPVGEKEFVTALLDKVGAKYGSVSEL